MLNAIKCNFTDFDTFSSLHITCTYSCSNTHTIGLRCEFATIYWQKRNNVKLCKIAYFCTSKIWGWLKTIFYFSWASELSFVLIFELQKSR